MRYILLFSILFCAIALPALAELTPQDLNKIRLIVVEEIQKESSIINQKIDKLDTRIDGLDTRIDGLDTRIDKLTSRIDGLDTRIRSVENNISWVRGKLEGVEQQVSHGTNITYGLIALIVAAIGIPAWRGKRDRDQERKIQALTAEIETLKQIVNS